MAGGGKVPLPGNGGDDAATTRGRVAPAGVVMAATLLPPPEGSTPLDSPESLGAGSTRGRSNGGDDAAATRGEYPSGLPQAAR